MQGGQFLAPLIAVPVSDATSWRFSVGIWAVPAALAGIVWLILALKLPANHHAPVATTESQIALRVSRSPISWGLLGLFAMMSLSYYAIITCVAAVLTDVGGSQALRSEE